MKKSELIEQELEQVEKLYCLELKLKEAVIDYYQRQLRRLQQGEDEDRKINAEAYNDFINRGYQVLYCNGYRIRIKEDGNEKNRGE